MTLSVFSALLLIIFIYSFTLSISSSKYTSSVNNLTNIRPNGESSAQMIFPFLGYGKYYIEFAGINGTVTAELDIKE